MFVFPEVVAPPEQRASAQSRLRYEDISQDGRVSLLALPHTIGAAVWQTLLRKSATAAAQKDAGIFTVLTRIVLEGGPGPVHVTRPIDIDGAYRFAHTVDERGEVDRILLQTWTEASAPQGLAGRAFAEDVFTRLFAPPGQRKVASVPGLGVPPDRVEWTAPATLGTLPPDVELLDAELVPDDATVVFGLVHTDANRHVNSLTYPRLFEDAALRRFAARGLSPKVLARRLEIGYRKPCFVGERVRIWLQAYQGKDGPGAVGVFLPEGAPAPGRPHCYLRMGFSP